jgi:hypothetical protein
MTICDEWKANPTINPRTRRKIAFGKATYNALKTECEKKSSSKKSPSPCSQWHARPNVNPRSGKFIQTGKGVYNALLKECGPAQPKSSLKRRSPPKTKTPQRKSRTPQRKSRTPQRKSRTPQRKSRTPQRKSRTPSPQRSRPSWLWVPSPRKVITDEEASQIRERVKASELWLKTSRSFDTSPLPWDPLEDEDEIAVIDQYEAKYGDKIFALGREVNAYWLYTFVRNRLTNALERLFPNGLKLKRGNAKIPAAQAASILLATCYYKARRGCHSDNPICLNVAESKLVMNGVAENFLSDDSFAGADWSLLGESTATLMNDHSSELDVPQIVTVHGVPDDKDIVILKPQVNRIYIPQSNVGLRIPGWQNLSEKALVQKIRDQYTERQFVERGMF